MPIGRVGQGMYLTRTSIAPNFPVSLEIPQYHFIPPGMQGREIRSAKQGRSPVWAISDHADTLDMIQPACHLPAFQVPQTHRPIPRTGDGGPSIRTESYP